jgi:serine/threonine protein kinase
MPQVVPCPACGKHLQLPDALAGKPVKCPQCARAFTAPAPTTACPVCGAAVADDAMACPDCGYHLGPAPAAAGPEPEDKLNVCPNPVCGTPNPPGERLCQRCNRALPGAIGHVIAGQYRIDQYLAEGGFGVVYKATETRTGQPVAIKEMIATDQKEFGMRKMFFRREADILKALQHVPIVPRLFDFVEDGAAAYLVIEFIPGDNLLNLMEKPGAQPFPVAQVATWGARICEALAHMHRMTPPLIHRDMKPENVMLLPDGVTIRLIDFGTAREMGHGRKERGVARTKVFTEGYAPPEQIVGKPEPRSDLFALAGTLYHLATGQVPEGFFTGRDLLKTLPDFPEGDRWFFELIGINLSEDPNDRYLTARDMKGDLERHVVTREIYCPKCGTATPAREPYCRGCAAPMAPNGPACLKCDRPNLLGSRFCVKCGARL